MLLLLLLLETIISAVSSKGTKTSRRWASPLIEAKGWFEWFVRRR
jgi:hypothetical protein